MSPPDPEHEGQTNAVKGDPGTSSNQASTHVPSVSPDVDPIPETNNANPSSTVTVNPTIPLDDSPMSPSDFIPLLECPVCHSTLSDPTTLHCGHSVCAEHVHPAAVVPSSHRPPPPNASMPIPQIPPTCPLSICTSHRSSGSSRPQIPASSRVAYLPAPRSSTHGPLEAPYVQPRVRTERKLDVTICKVISLIDRTEDDDGFVPTREDDSGTDEDSNEEDDLNSAAPASALPPPTPVSPMHRNGSGSRPREESGSPSSSTHRPRKRRRQRRSSGTGAAPALFNANVTPPPVAPQNSQERFEKDLRSEMNCEICFMLFYQPITTPCQHVSHQN